MNRPGNQESRPRKGPAIQRDKRAKQPDEMLTRRRVATQRLAPMSCGCVDPLTCAHNTRPVRKRREPDLFLTVQERVTLVRGHWAQHATRIVAGDHPLTRYSQSGRGWCFPTDLLDDLYAYIEFRRWLAITSDKRTGRIR